MLNEQQLKRALETIAEALDKIIEKLGGVTNA